MNPIANTAAFSGLVGNKSKSEQRKIATYSASGGMMGIHRYFGVSGYTYSLILLNPIGKRTIGSLKYKILRDPMLKSYEEQSGLKNIEDFEKLSNKELAIIKNNIIELTKNNIIKINSYLNH